METPKPHDPHGISFQNEHLGMGRSAKPMRISEADYLSSLVHPDFHQIAEAGLQGALSAGVQIVANPSRLESRPFQNRGANHWRHQREIKHQPQLVGCPF